MAASLIAAAAHAGFFFPLLEEIPLPAENSQPSGITTGVGGEIWFAERFADKIGRLNPDGNLDEFVIGSPGFYPGPTAITLGPDGNLWFIEESENQIGRITTDGSVTHFPLPSVLHRPNDITLGPDGRLWFTERSISRGFPTSGFIANMTTNGTVNEISIDAGPYSITRGPDGALWFTTIGLGLGRMTTNGQYRLFPTNDLTTFDITTGPDGALWFTYDRPIVGNLNGTPAGGVLEDPPAIGRMTTDGVLTDFFSPNPDIRPNAIVRGPEDNLWFTTEAGGVWRLNLAGTMEQMSFDSAEVDPSADLAVGGDGRLYFTKPQSNRIIRVDSLGFLPINLNGATPLGLARGPDDSIWFADYGGNRIGRIDKNGGIQQHEIGADHNPTAVAVGPDGAAWFTNPVRDTIGHINTNGGFAEISTNPQPSNPKDIVLGPDGNFWFTEYDAGSIGRITPEYFITHFTIPNPNIDGAGPRIAVDVPQPLDITVGPDGNLWFTDEGLNAIGRITTDGDIVEFPIPTAGSGPAGITAGGDGNLYFVESNPGRVARITTAGVITELGTPDPDSFPEYITLGPDGAVWFTEHDANRLGRIGRDGRITKFVLPVEDAGPTGIIGGPDGRLFVSLLNTSQIIYTELAAAEPTRTATSTRPSTPTRTPTVTLTVPPGSTATATPSITLTPTLTQTVPPGSTETATPDPTSTRVFTVDCFGDCDGDASVTISELISAVNIALGNAEFDGCRNADADRDGAIRINDLISAVTKALQGCSA